jgi:hypothetical protein
VVSETPVWRRGCRDLLSAGSIVIDRKTRLSLEARWSTAIKTAESHAKLSGDTGAKEAMAYLD